MIICHCVKPLYQFLVLLNNINHKSIQPSTSHLLPLYGYQISFATSHHTIQLIICHFGFPISNQKEKIKLSKLNHIKSFNSFGSIMSIHESHANHDMFISVISWNPKSSWMPWSILEEFSGTLHASFPPLRRGTVGDISSASACANDRQEGERSSAGQCRESAW